MLLSSPSDVKPQPHPRVILVMMPTGEHVIIAHTNEGDLPQEQKHRHEEYVNKILRHSSPVLFNSVEA